MKKYLLLISLSILALGAFLTYQYVTFNDGKLHVTFCNVGQGDAVLIKTPGSKYILVDAGPDKRVLECLSKHMPLWQRDIDLVLLTHPHADHFMGLYFVKDRYKIHAFATEELSNDTPGFKTLMSQLREKQVPQRFVVTGDRWVLQSRIQHDTEPVEISVVGPTQEFLDRTSPGGKIGESKEFASLILRISYGAFDALLTGDTQAEELADAVEHIGATVDVLQSPHHGSATGLNASILEQLSPELTVISVGKNNYGHPSLATLALLREFKVKRTDKSGDVEIISDGSNLN